MTQIQRYNGRRRWWPALPTALVGVAMLAVLCSLVPTSGITAPPSAATPHAPVRSGADVAEFGRPAARVFTSREGLPQNSIMSLAFDRKGYLWLGTQDGAVRYNGRAWTVTNLPEREISNMIRSVFVAADGAVWFGRQDGGLARLEGDAWQTFDERTGLPHNRVNTLAETRSSSGTPVLWAGTNGGGLARFANGVWSVVDLGGESAGLRVNQIEVVRSPGSGEHLLVATSRGLWSVSPDGQSAAVAGFAGDASNFTCVLAVGSEIWAGTGDGRLLRASPTPAVIRTYQGASVQCLMATGLRDDGYSLWVGTDGAGLDRFDGRNWLHFSTANILPSDAVWCLDATGPIEDPSIIWIGTDGGLVRVEEGMWRTYDQQAGLPSNSAYSLLVTVDEEGDQSLWAGLRGRGLVRVEGGKVSIYDARSGLPSNSVFALHERRDPNGGRTLWVGTQGGGIGTLEDGRFRPVTIPAKYPVSTVRRFLEVPRSDGESDLWAASADGGVLRLQDGEWTVFDKDSGLPTNATFSLEYSTAEDGLEAIWVGTQGEGVAYYSNGEWRTLGRESGLRNLAILGLHVARLRDGRRLLWAGTEGGGVSFLDLKRPEAGWTTLTDSTTPAIPNNTVYQVVSDALDRIYLFTNQGVARLTPAYARGEDAGWDVFRFTMDDGLPSNEFNGGASHVDQFGRIWGGTVAGVTMFDPGREPAPARGAPLLIEHQYLSDRGAPIASGQELRHDQNNVGFEFALLTFFREADTRYRTQLVGLEDHPTEWTSDYKRSFTTLPAGSYVFRVWARDYLGNETGPAEVAFVVQTAPWLRWWAFAAYGALLLALGFAAVRWRERTLRRRNEDLEARIAERTTELAEKSAELAEKVRQLQISERAASEAREEALEASRAKSIFLSNMSHELRTPLNAVLGFAQLMERDPGRSPEDLESLGVISRSGEHLLQLINDVLSISKIEAGRLTLNESPFDLKRLLGSVEEMMRIRAQPKGIQLELDILDKLPAAVAGDEGKVRQVLINLIGNAVKFTEAGGVAVRVRWENGIARFEVEDTGPGIAADELPTVFDAFVQTESGRQSREGTGLGLAITKSFVELMGGDIQVKSRLGEGTLFSFEFPLPVADATDLKRENERVSGLEPDQPEFRILVVDDKWENRTVLSRLLRSVGLEVREAADGREAVEVWRAWRPHLIWMDMRMPVMDGVAATRAIREEERALRPIGADVISVPSEEPATGQAAASQVAPSRAPHEPHTVIVALTASAFEHERDEILVAGCDDFVAKPFREATIFERLSEHLGLRFVYADSGAEGTPAATESVLGPDRLAALPAEWVDELEQALITGNVKAINAAVDQIALRDEPLAEEMRGLVRRYEFDVLIDVIEQRSR